MTTFLFVMEIFIAVATIGTFCLGAKYPWCEDGTNCAYTTFEHCMETAMGAAQLLHPKHAICPTRTRGPQISTRARHAGDDETTNDLVTADIRNFYKVERTRDDRIERMPFGGTNLDKAPSIFADYAGHRPAARLTIRQRPQVLAR